GSFKGELKVNNNVLRTGERLEDIFLLKQNASGETIFSPLFGSAGSDMPIPMGFLILIIIFISLLI
ncbi:MAG: hypothetical protein ABIU11_01890, partial [Chitinophagaceae bacterium]